MFGLVTVSALSDASGPLAMNMPRHKDLGRSSLTVYSTLVADAHTQILELQGEIPG